MFNNRDALLLLLCVLGAAFATPAPPAESFAESFAAEPVVRPQADTTHIVLLSDRILGTMVVLNSTCTSAARPSALAFHVITGREGVLVLPLLFRQIASCQGATLTVETVGSATESLRRRGFAPFWADGTFAEATSAVVEDEWGVRTPYRDAKHASPLNHLRFYLPHLPFLDGVDSFVFMDDDIVVQKDIVAFAQLSLAPGKAMAAGCQHWHWSPEGFVTSHDVKMRDTGYIGALDTACPDGHDQAEMSAQQRKAFEAAQKSCVRRGLEGELRDTADHIAARPRAPAHERLRGITAPHPLDRTAFNMGFNLIDAGEWKELRLSEHYEQWVAASVAQKLFPPDTLAFGLVLAYLALGDAVQCYDAQLTHLVGLAFIPQQRLEERYGWTAQRMEADAFALHYNGAHKPWDAPVPGCEEMEALAQQPRSALDIWRRHCGEFCPCSRAGAGAGIAGGTRVVHLDGRRLLNEYTDVSSGALALPAVTCLAATLLVSLSSTLLPGH